MSSVSIELVLEGAATVDCFPVMRQLRPDLGEDEFVQRVARQRPQGYQLLAAANEGEVVAVAGFRVLDNLAWGRFLYVDDLVTGEAHRSHSFGGQLLDWLVAYCQENAIAELHLDSGVQRFGAHRFYLDHRMDITSHHFAVQIPSGTE